MNMNRLRPTDADKKDLPGWLSSVIWDAIRDAIEAGMTEQDAHELVSTIAKWQDPFVGFKVKR